MQEWTSALVQHSFSCKYITSQRRSRLCLLRTNMDENQLRATFNALHCLHLPLIMSSISKCFCENMKQTPRLSGRPIPATWAVNPRDLLLCCTSNFTCLFFFFLLHVWYCLRCRMTMAGNLTASPPKKRGHGILNIHLHECTFIWLYGVWPFSNTHKLFDGALLSRLFPPPTPLFFLFFRISALTSYSHRLLLPLVCNQRKSTVVTVISNPWISVCSTKPPYWTPGDKDEAILLGLTSVSS